jgi:flavodoxin
MHKQVINTATTISRVLFLLAILTSTTGNVKIIAKIIAKVAEREITELTKPHIPSSSK